MVFDSIFTLSTLCTAVSGGGAGMPSRSAPVSR